MLLLLSRETFSADRPEMSDRLADHLRAAREAGVYILTMHDTASCEFDTVLLSSPDDLVMTGLFRILAVPLVTSCALEQMISCALGFKAIQANAQTVKRRRQRGGANRSSISGGAAAAGSLGLLTGSCNSGLRSSGGSFRSSSSRNSATPHSRGSLVGTLTGTVVRRVSQVNRGGPAAMEASGANARSSGARRDARHTAAQSAALLQQRARRASIDPMVVTISKRASRGSSTRDDGIGADGKPTVAGRSGLRDAPPARRTSSSETVQSCSDRSSLQA